MRSQTDEQLAARWDEFPWRCDTEHSGSKRDYRCRAVAREDHISVFDPRPECIPNGYANQPYRKAVDEQGREVWRHRPPVNPILVKFRNRLKFQSDVARPVRTSVLAQLWASNMYYYTGQGIHAYNPEQIEFARKVLTRLAALA